MASSIRSSRKRTSGTASRTPPGRTALLNALRQKVLSSIDLPTVLQTVVDAACDLTGARYGALAVFTEDGQIEQFITHGVTVEARQRIGALPQGKGLLGWLHKSQKPMRMANLSKDPHAAGFPTHHPPMRSFLGAPIRGGDAALGTLYLTEKPGGTFTAEDEELLVHFTTEAAVAIGNARLHAVVEQERRRLQAVVEASPVGVLVVEAHSGKVVEINHEMRRLLGLAEGEAQDVVRVRDAAVLQRPNGEPFAPDDTPLRRALDHGERVLAQEMTIVLPGGRRTPVLMNAMPVLGRDGRVQSAIATVQDILPLEEMERLRSDFLGMVSHQLKTPLTAIKGSAATALGSRRPLNAEETRELFEIIDEQSDRMRDLVDNLLDMTRIESGKLTVQPEAMDLREAVQEAVTLFAQGGEAHEVQVDVDVLLPAAHADRRRATQVLINLLGNAAKFSPVERPIVVKANADRHMVTVSVRDEGRGIAPDKIPHLFKKFSQVHAGGGFAGSGLGLAIGKGIIEAHGGRIWAESPGLGKGTTFTFTLPVSLGKPDVAAPQTMQRAGHMGAVHRPGEHTRILVLDDEMEVLRYLQRILEQEGFKPTVTKQPGEFLKLVESGQPDLVLMDMVLPGTTGLDLLKRIREFSGVPVIFLTARDDSESAVQALRAGADDYVTQPFSGQELVARIQATLRRRVLPDTMEVRPPFTLHDLEINFTERRVMVAGKQVALSATEYKLLYELATHAGRVLTHEQILHRVWGPEYSGEAELVRSFIRNLRRKIGDDARKPRYIFTEPQVGYRMEKA